MERVDYIVPEIEFVVFDSINIVTASGGDETSDDEFSTPKP